MDISLPRGPSGDSQYFSCLTQSRNIWMRDYHCTTGDDHSKRDAITEVANPVAERETQQEQYKCQVDSRSEGNWVESGLRRWRTVFSATGTDPQQYCKYWVVNGLPTTRKNPTLDFCF